MSKLLATIINASERAASVAKSCCAGDEITLLVAEKSGGEANTRFDKDFKTIADVLAQECAKTTIVNEFADLSHSVRGEECAEIGGVTIRLLNSDEETAELLKSIVQPKLADRMAAAAHSQVLHPISNSLPSDIPDIEIKDLGIWIDPIDATAEFIAGVNGEASSDRGLSCVTVLIGAYKISTGEPVLGVINQPFYDGGKGRLIWGVSYEGTTKWGGHNIKMSENNRVILMSGAEDTQMVQQLMAHGYDVQSVPGAGNKLMKVALGEAAAYVLSKGTTFLWDTCGPHAIIRAKGGDIKKFNTMEPIKYNIPHNTDTQKFCNSDGIIAYQDTRLFDHINSIQK